MSIMCVGVCVCVGVCIFVCVGVCRCAYDRCVISKCV